MASILKQLAVPKGKNTSTCHGRSQTELNSNSDPKEKHDVEADQDSLDSAPPHSPSPEAEYDKLLVSREKISTVTVGAAV